MAMTEEKAERHVRLLLLNFMREMEADAENLVDRRLLMSLLNEDIDTQEDLYTVIRAALTEAAAAYLAMCSLTGRDPAEFLQELILSDEADAAGT